MLKREYLLTRKDGVNLYRTYSDQNKYILQVETGCKYIEAIDIELVQYTYIELDEDIETESNDAQ